jgi:hypothetical protein
MKKTPRKAGLFLVGSDQRVEPEPDGPTVAPLGDEPAPTVEPDGFIAPLALLLTAPDVPADDVPEPLMPPEEPVLVVVLGVDAPTLPLPAPPLVVCANAKDDDMAMAEAIAMVASFMMLPFVFDTGAIPPNHHRSAKAVTTC